MRFPSISSTFKFWMALKAEHSYQALFWHVNGPFFRNLNLEWLWQKCWLYFLGQYLGCLADSGWLRKKLACKIACEKCFMVLQPQTALPQHQAWPLILIFLGFLNKVQLDALLTQNWYRWQCPLHLSEPKSVKGPLCLPKNPILIGLDWEVTIGT